LPFTRLNSLVAVLGLTPGNIETYKNPASLKKRLVEIFTHYARAVTSSDSAVKLQSGLLLGWDANMNVEEVRACYDNPEFGELVRSCPGRFIDTSGLAYRVLTDKVRIDNVQEVLFLSTGLYAERTHKIEFNGKDFWVERGQFLPVLNSSRFTAGFMIDGFRQASWRPDKDQLWSATGRVHYQHCTNG
jgi:hypothetical protein